MVRKETDCTRQYELETPTGTIKTNRVQLIPIPQEKGDMQNQKVETELNILSRRKRTVELSLKARESRGLKT